MSDTTEQEQEQFVGELYRNEAGNEVWRIKDKDTGEVLRADISSDREYHWLKAAFNHGDDYADAEQAKREAANQS